MRNDWTYQEYLRVRESNRDVETLAAYVENHGEKFVEKNGQYPTAETVVQCWAFGDCYTPSGYHPGCAACWLGHQHTWAKHERALADWVRRHEKWHEEKEAS